MVSMEKNVGFVGAGKVGFSLGKFFAEKGIPVSGYFSKTPKSAKEAAEFTGTEYFDTLSALTEKSNLLFLTVPDGQIAHIWEQLKKLDIAGKLVCHTSGALSSAVFSEITETGAIGLSVHPLLAISDRYESYKELPHALFTIEGTSHVEEMRGFLDKCGLSVQEISAEKKVRYHAAAAIASNLLVALYDIAAENLTACGFTEENTRYALAPLMEGNLSAALKRGSASALTGPVERGDTSTVREHLKVLRPLDKGVYIQLSLRLLDIARRKHPERDYGELEKTLKMYEEMGEGTL